MLKPNSGGEYTYGSFFYILLNMELSIKQMNDGRGTKPSFGKRY